MIKLEMNRIVQRPVFLFIILLGFVLALLPVFETWPHGVTSDYYVFYPRSAYVSCMLFWPSSSYYIYQMVFPLLASLVYSDSYAEDFNSGLIKGILTKVEKKTYLLTRYFVTFIIGGLVSVFPLVINFLAEMTAYPLIGNNYFFGMAPVDVTFFMPTLFYKHAILYIVVRLVLLFLLGGVLASLGLALSTFVRNRYVVVIFPFLVFMGLDVLFSSLAPKYSIISLFIGGIQSNIALPLYLIIGCVGSFVWFYLAGVKNETI